MPDEQEPPTTQEMVLEPLGEAADAPVQTEPAPPRIGLGVVFLVVLVLVAISNLWLRRRAEREQS
jgi:hypothetical protein